jgi:hypothetical protein
MAGSRSASRAAIALRGAVWLVVCVGAGPGGCAAPAPDASLTPDNLTIDVTVLRGAGAAEHSEAERRPGRYVLFSDGALHYADESDRDFRPGSDWLPAPTRFLDPAAMRDVWALVERLGLTDRDGTLPPIDLARVEASPGALTYVVEVTAWRRSRVRIDRAGDEPDAPGAPDAPAATADLVRMLATLAWGTDVPDASLVAAPRRYDFGPDPYAQYRRP